MKKPKWRTGLTDRRKPTGMYDSHLWQTELQQMGCVHAESSPVQKTCRDIWTKGKYIAAPVAACASFFLSGSFEDMQWKLGWCVFHPVPCWRKRQFFWRGRVYMMQHLVKSFSSAVCGSLLSKSSSCACLTNSSGLCYFFIALLNIRFMQGDKNTSFNKSIRINLDLDRCCVKAWPWNGPSIQASLQNTCRAS